MKGLPDKLKKEYLAVALLVGILCLILAIPVKKETTNEKTNTATEEKSEDLKEGVWQEQIQARLQNMLNESEGAGETKVFLTFENSWENVVEKDENQTVFEKEPLVEAARMGQLNAYRHKGFWQCMDTLREKQKLEQLWEAGNAPWKVWEK